MQGAQGALSSNDPDVFFLFKTLLFLQGVYVVYGVPWVEMIQMSFFIQNLSFSPGGVRAAQGALSSNDPDVFFYSKTFLFLQGVCRVHKVPWIVMIQMSFFT